MDGLDDQADAVVEGIIDQLFTTNNETVTIKHSSRDSLMLRITTALKDPQKVQNFCTKKLIFRGGISVNGLRWLEEALIENDTAIAKQIEELEFVGLQNKLTLEGVLLLTRRLNIKKLSLTTYGSRSQTSRIDRDLLAHTIRSGLLLSIQNHTLGSLVVDGVAGTAVIESSPKSEEDEMKLESLALTGYPLGSKGIEIVFEAVRHYSKCLKTLKLIDCDLRSDSNVSIANLIRSNPKIECMDLSHNRHYPGTSIQREMTIKTLVKRGLIYNMNLLELKMENTTNRPPPPSSSQLQRLQRHVPRVNQNSSSSSKKLSLIDRQLATNRFCKRLIKNSNEKKDDDRQWQQQKEQKYRCWDPTSIHPHIYSHVLAHVSSKPSALYLFLQENIPTLFPH